LLFFLIVSIILVFFVILLVALKSYYQGQSHSNIITGWLCLRLISKCMYTISYQCGEIELFEWEPNSLTHSVIVIGRYVLLKRVTRVWLNTRPC